MRSAFHSRILNERWADRKPVLSAFSDPALFGNVGESPKRGSDIPLKGGDSPRPLPDRMARPNDRRPPGAPAAPLPKGTPSCECASSSCCCRLRSRSPSRSCGRCRDAPTTSRPRARADPPADPAPPPPGLRSAGAGATLAGPARWCTAWRSVDAPSAARRSFARHLLGVPYRYGGARPATGFDCSGFVRYVYGHFGVSLPHSSFADFWRGRRVGRWQLKPGDLVFFDGAGHVGIYVGHGRFIHAPHTGTVVRSRR